MLILHHLGISQSERIVWLLEELQIPYKLVHHTRAPLTSPESLKSIEGNCTGKAPFFEDTDAGIVLSESGAICEYIVHRYGDGKLAVKPADKNYSEYLRWVHFSNATLQADMVLAMFMASSGGPPTDPIAQMAKQRVETGLNALNERLSKTQWLAGEFSIADIMNLYVTSTQRYWGPLLDLSNYTHILRWMKDCGDRPAYKRAMEKGDPEMKPLLTAEAPKTSLIEAGGASSDIWKA